MTTDRTAITIGLDEAKEVFHALLDAAGPDDLARPSEGTRWTNEQLLFHMMFGFLVVRRLLPLVRLIDRLPDWVGRTYVSLLDRATRPFDSINYWGSVLGSRVYRGDRMARKFDAVIDALERQLSAEPEDDLGRSMPFPVRWDPFFKASMTLRDVYRYPTKHFDFHRRQLTLL